MTYYEIIGILLTFWILNSCFAMKYIYHFHSLIGCEIKKNEKYVFIVISVLSGPIAFMAALSTYSREKKLKRIRDQLAIFLNPFRMR